MPWQQVRDRVANQLLREEKQAKWDARLAKLETLIEAQSEFLDVDVAMDKYGTITIRKAGT